MPVKNQPRSADDRGCCVVLIFSVLRRKVVLHVLTHHGRYGAGPHSCVFLGLNYPHYVHIHMRRAEREVVSYVFGAADCHDHNGCMAVTGNFEHTVLEFKQLARL